MNKLFLVFTLITLIGIFYYLTKIKKEINNAMSAIDNLKSAVDSNAATAADGFAAIGSALEELATDIQNLPQNADVEAEAVRLSGVTNSIAEHTAAFAQQIRDAVATPPVDPPADAPSE